MKEGWEYKKLGEILIFDKRFNGIPKEEQPKIAHFCHVSAEVLKNLRTEKGEVKLLSTGLFSASTTIDLAGNYINEGEVVTIPTGGVANIKYYKGKFVDSGNILGVSSGPQIVLKFVFYGMIANKELINSYFRGVSIKHPYMPDIYNIPIPLPPFTEQQRIVEELDLLSSIIEKKKAQLKELDSLAQSIFYDMFGNPILNDKGWEVKKIEEIGNVTTGNTPSRKKADFYNTEYIEWIKTDNILKDSIYATKAKEYLSEKGAKEGRIVDKNSLLVACIAGSLDSIGKVCVTNRKVAFNQQINAITPNQYFNVLFAYYTIKLMSSHIREHATSGMKHIITKSAMEKINLPLPPLPLQQQFAEKIEAIEHQKELIKQSINEVETLFNSRMDYYFN